MKIEDLMIGDWVYNKHHGKNIRLTQYDFFTHTHNEFGEQKLSPFAVPTSGRDLEPIPLTPEILEKNGLICTQKENEEEREYECWSFRESAYSIIYEPSVKMLEVHNGGENGSAIRTIQIYTDGDVLFVHELQHLLRFCNFNKTIEL